MSKLEDLLAEHLHFAGLPVPVRQYHFMWCCEHTKREHGTINIEWYCRQCYADDDLNVGPGHRCYHEYRKERNWSADFAYPAQHILIECEGGLYTNGRHVRGAGYEKDLEKYDAAEEAGWTLLRFSRRQITSGEALNQIERVLKAV